MLLRTLPGYKGKVLTSSIVPPAYRKYCLKHAWVRFITLDEGVYLVQRIRGRHFYIWVHRLFLHGDVCLGAWFDEECRTLNYTRKGKVRCELKGAGDVWLEEGSYHFFCVPPGVLHPCHFTAGEYCFMHLDMSDELLSQIDFNPLCQAALKKYFLDPAHNGVQLPPCSIKPMVEHCMDNISKCDFDDMGEQLAHITFHVNVLLNEFNRQIPKIKSQQKKDAAQKLVDEVMAYVDAHLATQLQVKTLVLKFHTTTKTLNRHFTRRTGKTVKAYIMEARMQEAQKLLRETHNSLAQIGALVGYPLVANFGRAYDVYFGVVLKRE